MSATARTDTSATTLFAGTERFFRPGYAANLVSGWIPALDGVEAKLRSGARVADIGCGHGASTILMAQAFPRSRFVGFDYHDASISRARSAAIEARARDARPGRHLADRRAVRRRPARGQPRPGRARVLRLVCTPASRDQEIGLALGAQAGEARLREVVTAGGFTRFRRATETPFNLVLEARP